MERVSENSKSPQLLLPEDFSVSQNFPNPFNPETEITFGLPERSTVKITILDLLGREVMTLTNAEYRAGYQRVRWDGTDSNGNKIGSGIYFYRITATSESGKQFAKVMKNGIDQITNSISYHLPKVHAGGFLLAWTFSFDCLPEEID
jgi:hypothetical protein